MNPDDQTDTPSDYIGALAKCLDVRYPESQDFDRVFRYAVVQAAQGMRMHEPVTMPADRSALIARATSGDEGCISVRGTPVEYVSDKIHAEYWARLFHETYERLAPSFGYDTRTDTRQFDPESKNGKLMVAVLASLYPKIQKRGFDAGFERGTHEAAASR